MMCYIPFCETQPPKNSRFRRLSRVTNEYNSSINLRARGDGMAKPRAETPAETFARRVKAARERQKLTQTELAIRSELTAAAISQIESGDRMPAFKTIVALARALGTTPNDLMGMEVEQLDPSLQELKGLFRDLKDMSPEDYEKVKAFASYLVADRKKKG